MSLNYPMFYLISQQNMVQGDVKIISNFELKTLSLSVIHLGTHYYVEWVERLTKTR